MKFQNWLAFAVVRTIGNVLLLGSGVASALALVYGLVNEGDFSPFVKSVALIGLAGLNIGVAEIIRIISSDRSKSD